MERWNVIWHTPSVALEQLPSGKWRAIVRFGGIRRSTPAFDTKREARAAEARALTALEEELGPGVRRRRSSGTTVAEAVDTFIGGRTYAPTTADEVARARRRLPEWFERMPVADVTPADVESVYRGLLSAGVAVSGVRRVHEVLSPAWKRAVRLGWARANVVAAAEAPARPERDVSPPELDVMGRLVAAVNDPQFAAYVRLAASGGLRRGEMVGLRWGDLDLDAGIVKVERAVTWTKTAGIVVKAPKTRAGRRTIALGSAAVDALKAWKVAAGRGNLAVVAPAHYVFGHLDRARRPDWATQRWVRLRDQLERAETVAAKAEGREPDYWMAGVRLHDVRHFHASDLFGLGVDPRTVAGRLGHSRASTTLNLYAHFLPERDRDAANLADRRLG